jgi:hypothetical protein
MTVLGTGAIVFFFGLIAAWRSQVRSRVKHAQREALQPGSVVLVRTPDRKQLVATVLSRGKSHFWIELSPGDARWWVPATAVEAAPEAVVREKEELRRSSRPAPRPKSDAETESPQP